MGTKRIEVYRVCGAGCHGFQFRGDGPLELARAGSVRRPCDHFLAGAGAADLEQDSVRRFSWKAGSHALAPAHGESLGTDVTRGAREVPPRHAGGLWPIWDAEDRSQGRIGVRCTSAKNSLKSSCQLGPMLAAPAPATWPVSTVRFLPEQCLRGNKGVTIPKSRSFFS